VISPVHFDQRSTPFISLPPSHLISLSLSLSLSLVRLLAHAAAVGIVLHLTRGLVVVMVTHNIIDRAADGQAWSWGMNYHGQCGRGGETAEDREAIQREPQPVRVAVAASAGGREGAPVRFVQAAAGFIHAMLLAGP
jgi:hypothetical protein